jgi:hypothetical protein
MPFLETSACQAVNIDNAFKILIDEIHKKYHKLFECNLDDFDIIQHNAIDLNKNGNKSKKDKKCCLK